MLTDKDFKKFHEEFKYLEEKIKQWDKIVIYRHVSPDFDAMGAQMGLYTWIKDNFPNKEVHYVGDHHPTLMPSLYPFTEELDESFYYQPHLALTVDISNLPRLSENHLSFAKEVIKIDHHPIPEKKEEQFGDYLIVHPDRPAASEILALFVLSRNQKKLHVSQQCAAYLYSGIVGDTSRFLYQDTDGATLRISADLLDTGFDKTLIYDLMYKTDERRIQILRFCLNNYHLTEKGTCYFIFHKEDMEELHMTTTEGNLHINTFRNMDKVRVVCSITWDDEKQEYRVSLRSGHLVVSPVAVNFGGGGHDFAAGCKIKTLDMLPDLIAQLDALE